MADSGRLGIVGDDAVWLAAGELLSNANPIDVARPGIGDNVSKNSASRRSQAHALPRRPAAHGTVAYTARRLETGEICVAPRRARLGRGYLFDSARTRIPWAFPSSEQRASLDAVCDGVQTASRPYVRCQRALP